MSIEKLLISHNKNRYKEYIDNHRNNVRKAWENIKNNEECIQLIKKYIPSISISTDTLDELIYLHDLSKYESEEFDAYRKNFYPISQEEKDDNKQAFEEAWKHHYMNNLHHWDYWYHTNNLNNMPFIYVVEMICDWEAMGYQFGNTSKEWYDKNKDKIYIGDSQRELVESLIEILSK